MLLARPGAAPLINIKPYHYLRQSLAITLLNPKAIIFYMAFFPVFVDPVKHQGFVTFSLMAVTVAVLTFLYGLSVVLLTYFLAERFRSQPRIALIMGKLAGLCLIGFGIKLFFSR